MGKRNRSLAMKQSWATRKLKKAQELVFRKREKDIQAGWKHQEKPWVKATEAKLKGVVSDAPSPTDTYEWTSGDSHIKVHYGTGEQVVTLNSIMEAMRECYKLVERYQAQEKQRIS